ncbi:NAD(P)-dependent oxidoreductase [Roseomonas sp. CCTCC AB2023176]|uniref:NAD(P)-dependent oxidoreductase n=1 Tax=Roseomonas sp. CCTCC AB2023176 TaxID=3342640 RepID=UPI0035E04179
MAIGTVGVIGLGNMGLGMAGTLARAGFDVLGQDLSESRRDAAVEAGIRFTSEARDALRAADILVLSLPFARDVEAVLTQRDALLSRRDRRVVVLDTTTSDPGTSRRLHARLAEAGHGFVDAPVSGGPAGARAGTLTVMAGGDAADLEAAKPVLDAIAGTVLHVGASGAGNVAKLVNNLLVAAHLITAREALRLSEAAGLPAADALRVVNAATGRSAVTEAMIPRWILPATYDSGFTAGLMRKDVALATALAAETGLDAPLSALVHALWHGSRDAMPDTDDFTRMADYRSTPDA